MMKHDYILTFCMNCTGCNPKPKNNEGNTARSIAKDEGHKEAMKELRKAEKTFGKVKNMSELMFSSVYHHYFHVCSSHWETKACIMSVCAK